MKSIAIDIDEPVGLPLDLETVKSDLRIDPEGDLDSVLVEQYIPDALSWAEGSTRRTILARAHRWILADFPRTRDQVITLPRGKAQSVASIAYSLNGSITTLTGPSSGSPEGTDYQEDLRGTSGRLMPNRGSSWPSVDCDAIAPVVITFTAGWEVGSIPAPIRRAMTVAVYEALELKGLLDTRAGFDVDFRDKIISAWRLP